MSKHFVLKVDVLEAGEMGKCKDLSESGEGQILMARRLGQSISKTAAVVGVFPICSGEPATGQGQPRLTDACWE